MRQVTGRLVAGVAVHAVGLAGIGEGGAGAGGEAERRQDGEKFAHGEPFHEGPELNRCRPSVNGGRPSLSHVLETLALGDQLLQQRRGLERVAHLRLELLHLGQHLVGRPTWSPYHIGPPR